MKYLRGVTVVDAWPWPLSDKSISEVIEILGDLDVPETFRMIAGLNTQGMKKGWLVKETGGGKPMLVSDFTFKKDYRFFSEAWRDEVNAIKDDYAREEKKKSLEAESALSPSDIVRGGMYEPPVDQDPLIAGVNIRSQLGHGINIDGFSYEGGSFSYESQNRAFTNELAALINKHSLEGRFDIPDFLLAEMLMSHLTSLERVLQSNREWWGTSHTFPKAT
jgi:hypothetical protein